MPWISRKQSMYEAATNVVINFMITPLLWFFFILPVLGITLPVRANFFVIFTLTAVSALRQYVVRRYFHMRNHT